MCKHWAVLSRVTYMSKSCLRVAWVSDVCEVCEWVMSVRWVRKSCLCVLRGTLRRLCVRGWVRVSSWVCFSSWICAWKCVFEVCCVGPFRKWEIFAHTNESCHKFEWIMSHIRMSHVTHMNESCHAYEWVMSHIWMSLATYEWVMSHMNESCHTDEWVISHIRMRHDTYG